MSVAFLAAIAAAASGSPACFATAREVPAGMPLATGDLTPVPCRSKAPHPPLRYDSATRGPIAASVLPAGTYLGRLMPLPGKQVAAGEPLVLRSSIGPVTIERNVTAMQPGSSGKRLFVRDAEGRIFAVRYDAEDGQ